MEKTFGVICEGPSDFRILKRIVEIVFKNDSVSVSCYQPKQLENGNFDYGNWKNVTDALKNKTLEKIFEFNNFAILQIDTDCSEEKHFEVKHCDENLEVFYSNVETKLKSLINDKILSNYKEKILFAICIHSIECWLLPIVYKDSHKKHSKNCLDSLNRAVQRKYKKMPIIKKENKNQSNGIKVYSELINNWKKKADIESVSKNNIGFEKFINSLNNIE